ncbi:cobalamin biosynthesis protein CobD/CbiB [Neptunicella marina]|uniref:Cobalamin biosynthesis protein n=1 Tax=Neptunicella marina TaxID=2125989 RepID=A0A8J6M0T8_9ALTE|nr:cobalamin biosynthesis protein [Neptunicella marina]MBC3765188.1 cobalamin biosynthesis protein [Neptunicella marina]
MLAYLSPLMVLLVVILLERLWVWPLKYHPLSLIRMIAAQMSAKVNKAKSSASQQRISGGLAMVMLLVPALIIIWLFIELAEYPLFFNGLLLFIALEFSNVRRAVNKSAIALSRNKKALARNMIDAHCLRDTELLSPIGIAKTCCEVLTLRFAYQYWGVIFWYLIAGGLSALAYRLVIEMAYAWNTKLPQYSQFGHITQQFKKLLCWLPVHLLGIAILLAHNIKNGWRAIALRSQKNSHTFILAAVAGTMQFQLGGPVMYSGKKVRYQKLGPARYADAESIRQTSLLMDKALIILLVLTLLIYAGLFALRKTL